MSGPKYLDALASERNQNATLKKVIVGIFALAVFGIYIAHSLPKSIDVNISPSINAGETIQVRNGESPVPDITAYSFAYLIWQQINRWQTDGNSEYGQQIYAYQSYLTPRCQHQLAADVQARSNAGELRERTRLVAEIPGLSYAPNRVFNEGVNGWTVLLDLQVKETFRGQPVKDVYIRYPIHVVRYDVDRQRNPWRLAIDCYGNNVPARLNEKDLRDEQTKQLKVPSLPSSVSPAKLPDAVVPAETKPDPAAKSP